MISGPIDHYPQWFVTVRTNGVLETGTRRPAGSRTPERAAADRA